MPDSKTQNSKLTMAHRLISLYNIIFVLLPGPILALLIMSKHTLSGDIALALDRLNLDFVLQLVFLISTVGLWRSQRWAYLMQVTFYFLQVPILELENVRYQWHLTIFHLFFDFTPRFLEKKITIGFEFIPLVIFLLLCTVGNPYLSKRKK